MEAKGIRIMVEGLKSCLEADGQDIFLEGDSQRLEHVLMNYLSNAVKFSPAQVKVFRKRNVHVCLPAWGGVGGGWALFASLPAGAPPPPLLVPPLMT